MIGRRVDDPPGLLAPGEYGRIGGVWHGCTPTGDLANLSRHTVTENEDGTITVSPSILVSAGQGAERVECWHGWLQCGVWVSC